MTAQLSLTRDFNVLIQLIDAIKRNNYSEVANLLEQVEKLQASDQSNDQSRFIKIVKDTYSKCLKCHLKSESLNKQVLELKEHETELNNELCSLLQVYCQANSSPIETKIFNSLVSKNDNDSKALTKKPFKNSKAQRDTWLGRFKATLLPFTKLKPRDRKKTNAVPSPLQRLTYEPVPPSEFKKPSIIPNNCDEENSLARLCIYCFGEFRVFENDRLVKDWPNSKSKIVFKYLLSQRDRAASKEVLMGQFWPDASQSRARNSLNVAIYHIRHNFISNKKFPFILFQNDRYFLNPKLNIWVDVDEFDHLVHQADQLEREQQFDDAIDVYQTAEKLYLGDYLSEDIYEDWSISQRQDMRQKHLKSLKKIRTFNFNKKAYESCISYCKKAIEVESCDEEAHRQIMCCYSRLDQVNLAIRQFHLCVESLKRELNLPPSPETLALFQRIRQRVHV
jgi:DNA-binding SARP family transcriptional activator